MPARSKRHLVDISAALFLLLAGSAQAVEIMRWERLPLAVPLVVGQERIVFLDQSVRVGKPSNLADSLRVQSANGAIYLRAEKAIEPTRLQLQSVDTGELILIDIAATEAKPDAEPLEPVKIVRGESSPVRYGARDQATDGDEPDAGRDVEGEQKPSKATPVPVVLTRYASQSLYAPLRTVEPVDGITQVNVRRDLDLSGFTPLWPVAARAVASWRLDDYWVTAVQLKNLSPARVDLDPRGLQGDLATATFQHQHLGTRGDPSDTTVVYVVTKGRELAKAVVPAQSQVDASKNMGARQNVDQ